MKLVEIMLTTELMFCLTLSIPFKVGMSQQSTEAQHFGQQPLNFSSSKQENLLN